MSIPTINLLPAYRESAARARRCSSRWMLLGSGYAGALLLVCGAVGASGGGELSLAQARADDVQARLERAEAAKAAVQGRVVAADARVAVARAIDEHPNLTDLLRVVASVPPPEVAVLRVRVSREPLVGTGAGTRGGRQARPAGTRYILTLEGLAPTPVEASRLAVALEGLALFDSVKQQASGSSGSSGAGGVRFTIECSLVDRKGEL